MLIYLVLIDGAAIRIAACEDASHATPYLARGYVEVSAATYSAFWAERDRQARVVGGRLVEPKKMEKER